jgi:hypothetical protein
MTMLFGFMTCFLAYAPCPIGFWIDEKQKDEVGFGGIW